MSTDAFAQFKAGQREGWTHFAPTEVSTAIPAANLVRFAKIVDGARVLDVATGTGVVAVTAARIGARVTGLDLTPDLLDRARQNAMMAEVAVEWCEGDAEALPFDDSSFDFVVSQFGHIFAPRPEVVTLELLRVLRPGGTLAFATWPPHSFVGRFLKLTASFSPSPPVGFTPPGVWGDESFIRTRLGDAVTDLAFEAGAMYSAALSPGHFVAALEQTVAPARAIVKTGGAALLRFRAEALALSAEYFANNQTRQDYLMTRAIKR